MTVRPLTDDEKLAVAAGLLERGSDHSYYEVNDFRRCTRCDYGYFISATGRAKLIKCPYCDNVQERQQSEAYFRF